MIVCNHGWIVVKSAFSLNLQMILLCFILFKDFKKEAVHFGAHNEGSGLIWIIIIKNCNLNKTKNTTQAHIQYSFN